MWCTRILPSFLIQYVSLENFFLFSKIPLKIYDRNLTALNLKVGNMDSCGFYIRKENFNFYLNLIFHLSCDLDNVANEQCKYLKLNFKTERQITFEQIKIFWPLFCFLISQNLWSRTPFNKRRVCLQWIG